MIVEYAKAFALTLLSMVLSSLWVKANLDFSSRNFLDQTCRASKHLECNLPKLYLGA